jgi:hypothetical protein
VKRGFRSNLVTGYSTSLEDLDLDYFVGRPNTPVASLADWFDSIMRASAESEDGLQGKPIVWSSVVKRSRVSQSETGGASAQEVPGGNSNVGNQTAGVEVIVADFRFSEVSVRTEFGEVLFQRTRGTSLANSVTEITCGEMVRAIQGCISSAWTVDSGRAIVMLTHMREYWVLAAEGLTFFGAPKSVGPQQNQSKPNFVCDLGRLFLIFPQGEVFEVLPPEGLKGYYLPVFPIDIWSEIDSISRTMLPSDLCEVDANYRVARLPDPKLERELTDVMKASGYDSPLTRVLKHLVNLGLTTVRDVFEGDPDKLFPTATHRLKSRKVAVSLIATEIRRSYPSDFLGLEVNLLLRGLVERGWPPLENSDPAIRAPRYRVAELEKDFRTYPANLDGANLPVRQVKASAGSPKHLDLVLEGGVIVTVDEEFMAIEILVPFWRSDSGSAESGFRPISHSGYGRATLALLANYAGVIEGRVCDGTQEFVLPDFWPGKEIETRDDLSGGKKIM